MRAIHFLTTVAALTLISAHTLAETSNPNAQVSGKSSIGGGSVPSSMGSPTVNTTTTTGTGTSVTGGAVTAPSAATATGSANTTVTGTSATTAPTDNISGSQSSTSGSINGNIQPTTTQTNPAVNAAAGTPVPANNTSVTGGTPGTSVPAQTPDAAGTANVGTDTASPNAASASGQSFSSYDTNNDGNLSQAEYTSLSSQINQPGNINVNTPTTFNQIDTDGNGAVSKQEFDAYAEAHK